MANAKNKERMENRKRIIELLTAVRYTTNDIEKVADVICSLFNVSHCGLTNEEVKERDMLLRLQSDHTRWFTKEEFDRLKELSNKMFKNAGSPHCG